MATSLERSQKGLQRVWFVCHRVCPSVCLSIPRHKFNLTQQRAAPNINNINYYSLIVLLSNKILEHHHHHHHHVTCPMDVAISTSDLNACRFCVQVKGNVLRSSLPSIGPGADPGVQEVSTQLALSHPPGVGCHYFLPSLRLPSQPKGATAYRPVSNYTGTWV